MLDLRRLALFILLGACAVTSLEARTRKGDKYLQEGREAETRKQWETALDLYEKALLEDPADPSYQMAVRRVRFQAAMAYLHSGQRLRSAGKLEEAVVDFQKAYSIDPSLTIAEQELRRTKEMLDREKAKASPPDQRGMTPVERAVLESEQKASRMLPVPELKPINPQINTLKMNNQPVRVLYETVGKLAGINVVVDAEFQNPPGKSTFTIDLSNTTLDEALDYIAIQTKTFWKPLSPNTIFITNDNVTKRRDYEDYVVKVFYIKNATSVQELQEISTTVRSVTEIRRAFTYNAQWAILVRGTADQVALAEKLIQDLDKPRSEVVVDVIIMEANRARVRDLAASITTGGVPGLTVPIVYGATGSSTGPSTGNGNGNGTGDGTGNGGDDEEKPPGTSIRLKDILSLGSGDFSTIVPGALIQAVMSDSQTRVLQQPQVRAVEMQKATLHIGSKIPYASGSFQPGVGTVGLNPLVSTQFQFYDVGVKLDIQPKVHTNGEVSMHVEVELSNKAGDVSLGGISQPIISLRRVVHDIRITEGQVNLLGGLMNQQDTRTVEGIPLLMNIPILGRLFGPEHKEINRGEMLIALVPHIVRAPDYTDVNLRGVAAGNDQNLKLNYAPRPIAPPAPSTPPPAPAPAAAVEGTKPQAAAPAGGPALVFNPATVQTTPSGTVTVSLNATNVTDLFTAPVRIKFDPKLLRLTSIQPGSLLNGDGQKINFSENTMNDTGEAMVTLNRVPGSGGVSGSGPLLNLTFQALAPGTATVSVVDAALTNMQLQPMSVNQPSLTIVVQ